MANESGTPTTLDLARPSFTDFWKKSKSAIGGSASKIRFVESKTPSQGSGRKTSGDGGKGGGGGGGGGTTPAESSSSPSPPSQQQQQQHQSPPNTANGNDNSNNANTTQQPQQPLDKAQLRRLQVRRAQTQHRQRKANYIRQLETDVARLRDMIEAAEKDTRDLAKENEQLRKKAMEAAISGAKIGGGGGGGAAGAAASAIPSPGSSSGMTAGLLSPTSSLSTMTTKQTATLQTPRQIPLSLDQEVEMIMGESAPPAPADVGELTVSLGFDDVINAPTFYVYVAESVGPPAITVSPPASAVYPPPGTQPQALQRQQHHKQGQQQHSQATTTTTSSSAGTTTSPNYNNHDDLPDLTPAQTQAAINFILA
jgi:hypothetical protein